MDPDPNNPASEPFARRTQVVLGDSAEPPRGAEGPPGEESRHLLSFQTTVQNDEPDEPAGEAAEPIPSNAGRYRLGACIGRGGFGEVWRAFDPVLGRPVAVKILRPDRRLSAAAEAGLLAEARRLAQLDHPGIVRAFDCGTQGARCFFVSELIEGGTLLERMTRGPVPAAEAAEIAAQVAEALHHAHLLGFIHRDIKPSNILLRRDGSPVVSDFGLATTEREQLGEHAGTLGTLPFMSPEQHRGENHLIDGRSDIYSLGVVLYQMLTRRLPFLADRPEQYRELALTRDPRPPRSIDDTIPPALERVCLKCLARPIGERYTTALDLARDLRAACQPEAIAHRRRPARTAAFAAGAICVAAAVVFLAIHFGKAPDSTPGGNAGSANHGGAGTTGSGGPAAEDDSLAFLHVHELPDLTSGAMKWEIAPEDNLLRLSSEGVALLALEASPENDFEFAVDIEQPGWPGDVGVFFGLADDTKVVDQSNFELICVERLLDRSNRLVYSTEERSRQPKSGQSSHILGSEDLGVLSAAHKRLRIRFRAGSLEQVEFDGRLLPELVSGRLGAPSQVHNGALGFWCFKSQATFSHPVVNGKSVRFKR